MLRKFAVSEAVTAWIVPENASLSAISKAAHRTEFEYQVRPGYLYVRSRMISSRCNDNWDEFPAEEIEKSYRTFLGKPVFVNHSNTNHRRARGAVIRVALHRDRNPDGTPDTWVEGLMEVDAKTFPKLAAAILAGRIDRTSMGVDVDFSKCSACGNIAADVADYCQHIPSLKGRKHVRYEASGRQRPEFIRETCYGLRFFENSLLVEEPADPTAVFTGVDVRGLQATAVRKTALPAEPHPGQLQGGTCRGGTMCTYGGTHCVVCHEPVKINLHKTTTPTAGWHHHDGMKRDHPAVPADPESVIASIPAQQAARDQATEQVRETFHRQLEEYGGRPLPRRRRDEGEMPPDPFLASRTAALPPDDSSRLIEHMKNEHGLSADELKAHLAQATARSKSWDFTDIPRFIMGAHRDLHGGDLTSESVSEEGAPHRHNPDDPLHLPRPDSPAMRIPHEFDRQQEYKTPYLHPDRTDEYPNRMPHHTSEDPAEWGNLGSCSRTYTQAQQTRSNQRSKNEPDYFAYHPDRLREYDQDMKSWRDKARKNGVFCPECGAYKFMHATYRPSEVGKLKPEPAAERAEKFRSMDTTPYHPLRQSLNRHRTAAPHPDHACPECGTGGGERLHLPVGGGRTAPSNLISCPNCAEIYDGSKSGEQARVDRDAADMAFREHTRAVTRQRQMFRHVTDLDTHPMVGWQEGRELMRQQDLHEHQNTQPFGVPTDPSGSDYGRKVYRTRRERALSHSEPYPEQEEPPWFHYSSASDSRFPETDHCLNCGIRFETPSGTSPMGNWRDRKTHVLCNDCAIGPVGAESEVGKKPAIVYTDKGGMGSRQNIERMHRFMDQGYQPLRDWSDDDALKSSLSTRHEAARKYEDPGDHPWFQVHPLSDLHIVRAFHEATQGERASGKIWYPEAHEVAKALAGGDAAKGAGVLAAYSPRTFWPANIVHASRSLRTGRAIGPGEGASVMTMHQAPAQRIMNGEHWSEVLKGPKTRAFAHLIEHGGESDEDRLNGDGPVVIDRHALSVAAGRRLSDRDVAGAPLDIQHYYDHAAAQYRSAARKLSDHFGEHITAEHVQAGTWLAQVRKNMAEDSAEGNSFGGGGRVTRNRNMQNEWNETAREHHPSVQHLFQGKLWPRTALPGSLHTAITGESAEPGHDIWAVPHGTSPAAAEVEHNMMTREPGESGETWYQGTSYHGPYHIIRHPETRHTYVVDAQGRNAGTHGHSYGNWERDGTWGEQQAEKHWHGLESAGPDRDRTGTREEPSFALMKERTPAFEHSRIDPLDEDRAQRPDARVHKPEGYSPDDEYHGSYEVVRHPDTGRYHIVDNAGRSAGGIDLNFPTQMKAERSRDYIEKRQQSKEKAKGIVENFMGGIHEIFDPGGTAESRESDRHLRAGQDLMGRYAGGRGTIKFDDEEEGGRPYYERDHYLPGGKPSGWYTKHYGGDHADIYHRATGDEIAHDMIRFPQHPEDENVSMVPRVHPDFDDISLGKALENWHDNHDEGGDARRYLEQSDPRIRRWKMRHQGTRHHHAYGETRVPPEVDTLREEECPVCGEQDVYSGDRCPVCGFVSPPQMFKDPDLERAKQMDLRQDQAEDAGIMPQQGLQVPGQEAAGQAPDAQGSFPDADGQLQHPDQIAPDGVPGEMGATEDQQPVLTCTACGFAAPAAGAVSETTTPEQPAAMGFREGDPCPSCGQGMLMSSDDIQMAEGMPPGAQGSMGTEALPGAGDMIMTQPGGATPGMPVSPEESAAILGQQPVQQGAPGGNFPEGEEDAAQDAEAAQEAADDQAAEEQEEEDQDGPPVDDDDPDMKGRSRKRSREGSRMSEEAVLRQLRLIVGQNRQLLAQNGVLRAQIRTISVLAGCEPEMAAIERTAALRLRADINNPASPVPDPPEQGAPESTEQALMPDAMDDPRRPGLTPGSVTNVPAMQTTTPLRPGVEDQVPPATNLIDVTAPVAGTNPAQDGGVPLPQRRIETDVRVGDPMNPEIAFPWNDNVGPDSGQDAMTGGQRATSRQADDGRARVMASMRLAGLRLTAGLARGDQMDIAGQIEADAALTLPVIEHEITTLSQLSARQPQARSRTASVRSAPSLAGAPARPRTAAVPAGVSAGGEDLVADADLFM